MAKYGQRESPSPDMPPSPSQFPATTPPGYNTTYDPSFILQSVLEMQKNLGQLNQAITNLTEESKKNGVTLGEISHKVYAAKVVIWIAGIVLGGLGSAAVYILCEIWKSIYPLLQLRPHP